mmetsp:Transcript_7120/g.18629  ORF Transcript_7120/g.18629 Transcript_7120/m.18629 type:complete len:236 (-) Transcript_7120:1008-1715(-)
MPMAASGRRRTCYALSRARRTRRACRRGGGSTRPAHRVRFPAGALRRWRRPRRRPRSSLRRCVWRARARASRSCSPSYRSSHDTRTRGAACSGLTAAPAVEGRSSGLSAGTRWLLRARRQATPASREVVFAPLPLVRQPVRLRGTWRRRRLTQGEGANRTCSATRDLGGSWSVSHGLFARLSGSEAAGVEPSSSPVPTRCQLPDLLHGPSGSRRARGRTSSGRLSTRRWGGWRRS